MDLGGKFDDNVWILIYSTITFNLEVLTILQVRSRMVTA